MLKSTRDLNEQRKRILDKGKVIPEIKEIEESGKGFTKPELTSDSDE